MYPPAEMGLPKNALLRLLKALYGLKQASRLLHALIAQLLIEYGFSRLRTHSCIFFMRNDAIGRLIIIALYVDDLTIASKLQEDIDELHRRLRKQLQIMDGLEHILGDRITDRRQTGGRIRLDMDEYADDMLQELAEHIPTGKGVRTSTRHIWVDARAMPSVWRRRGGNARSSLSLSQWKAIVFPERSTARHHSLDNNVCKIYGQALITSLGSSATCSEASTDSSSCLPRVPSPRWPWSPQSADHIRWQQLGTWRQYARCISLQCDAGVRLHAEANALLRGQLSRAVVHSRAVCAW